MRAVEKSFAVAVIVLLAAPVVAQSEGEMPQMSPEEQAMMEAYQAAGALGHEHEMLAESVGEYDMVVRTWMGPGGEVMEESGTAKRHMMLGGRVMVEEVSSTMMGMPFDGYGLSGFDNVTGKYWATWNDSMSTGIMVAEGTCDEMGGTCTFIGTYNDPVTKQETTSRMTIEHTDETTELFTMYGPGPDGNEMKMMEITYTKK